MTSLPPSPSLVSHINVISQVTQNGGTVLTFGKSAGEGEPNEYIWIVPLEVVTQFSLVLRPKTAPLE